VILNTEIFVMCVEVACQVASLGEHKARRIYTQDGRLDLRSVSH